MPSASTSSAAGGDAVNAVSPTNNPDARNNNNRAPQPQEQQQQRQSSTPRGSQRHSRRSEEGAMDATTPRGTPPLAPRTAPVPLITPRYQRKSRTNRRMDISDSMPDQLTASEALRSHATERMRIQSGPMQYDQLIHFHTYDVYRHGKNQIHSRSVGYSSEGDIVMTREDVSEPGEGDNRFTRKHVLISSPTVLDSSARRPLSDGELLSGRKIRINRPRYKKYPGIYAPRNKKTRNRLINDYFAHDESRKLLEMARNRREEGLEDDQPVLKPSFGDLPPAVLRAFDLKDDAQTRELERLGITMTPPATYAQQPRDPDAAETRFQGLNLRLRSELQHALSSEFLRQQIEDLEVVFMSYIQHANVEESLVIRFRDGYGRLICHGVGAYYLLHTESRPDAQGSGKLTYVSLPQNRKTGVRRVHLPNAPLMHILRRSSRSKNSCSPSISPQATPQQMPQSPMEAMPPLELEPAATADVSSTAASTTPNVTSSEPTTNTNTNTTTTDAAVIVASGLVNRTVIQTVNGVLPNVEVPIYVPELRLDFLAIADGADVLRSPSAGPQLISDGAPTTSKSKSKK